jgi:hypothetical protein
VRTVTEFIAHAKANPGRINMGSEVDLDFCQGSRDARGASKSAAE